MAKRRRYSDDERVNSCSGVSQQETCSHGNKAKDDAISGVSEICSQRLTTSNK